MRVITVVIWRLEHRRLRKTTHVPLGLMYAGSGPRPIDAVTRRSAMSENWVPAPELPVGRSNAKRQHRGRRSRSIQPVSTASVSQGVQKHTGTAFLCTLSFCLLHKFSTIFLNKQRVPGIIYFLARSYFKASVKWLHVMTLCPREVCGSNYSWLVATRFKSQNEVHISSCSCWVLVENFSGTIPFLVTLTPSIPTIFL